MSLLHTIGPDEIDDEPGEPSCEVCGSSLEWEDCDVCGGEGYSGHDCGEDVCCCLWPEDNEVCHQCDGKGGWWWCYNAKNHAAEGNNDA